MLSKLSFLHVLFEQVKLSKENYHHDLAQPYSLILASADFNGKIIVWNATQGSVISEFSESSKPVAGIIQHVFTLDG